MVKTTLTHDRSQAGFTLVELAIVMIIIGLLIGGILKGQELIANAQVTATASQIKAIEAATNTFRDSYNAVPGDMLNPATRLPNCAAATVCGANAGNGNNRVDDDAPGAAQTANTEGPMFWTHLAAADMIGGVDSTVSNVATWGAQLPAAELGGGFTISFSTGNAGTRALASLDGATTAMQGHYLALQLLPNAAIGAATNLALSPTQAARIDRKLDDGAGRSGSVIGVGGATCTDAAGVYIEASGGALCNIYARVQ